jgi:hypothetical protein
VAEIPDDKLMAYADGALDELTPFECGQIEAALRCDARVRRRFEIFRATGLRISPLFGTGKPVPAHLKNFVLNYGNEKKAASARRPAANRKSIGARLGDYLGKLALKANPAPAADWLAGRIAPPARWQVAAVASALIVGPAAGWFAHRTADPSVLVTFQDGRVFAAGPLHRVLEESPSQKEFRIGGAAASDALTMRANLTFRTKTGWCREYDLSAGRPDESFVGLGCRDADGRWSITVNLPTGAKKQHQAQQRTGVAGRDKPGGEIASGQIDAVVERIIVGDALDGSEEAAVISRGWK